MTATFVFHKTDGSRLERIVGSIDAGTLRILVDREVSLQEFDAAIAR